MNVHPTYKKTMVFFWGIHRQCPIAAIALLQISCFTSENHQSPHHLGKRSCLPPNVPVMADSVGRIGQGQCLNSPLKSVPEHQLLQHLGTALKVSTLRCESHALAIFGIPRISENIHNLRPLGIHKLRSIEKIFGHFDQK